MLTLHSHCLPGLKVIYFKLNILTSIADTKIHLRYGILHSRNYSKVDIWGKFRGLSMYTNGHLRGEIGIKRESWQVGNFTN